MTDVQKRRAVRLYNKAQEDRQRLEHSMNRVLSELEEMGLPSNYRIQMSNDFGFEFISTDDIGDDFAEIYTIHGIFAEVK